MINSFATAPNYLLFQPQLNATVTRLEDRKTMFSINDENFESILGEYINNKEISISYSPAGGDTDDGIKIEVTNGPVLGVPLLSDNDKLAEELDIIFKAISLAEPLRIKTQRKKYSEEDAPDFRETIFLKKMQEYLQLKPSVNCLRNLFLPPVLPSSKFSAITAKNELIA